jgi:ABC-type sugar transport system ATPase subunit
MTTTVEAPATTLLAVSAAVKDYPGQRALDSMDFQLRAGEIHALLGENGAGKSTLIKAIGGAISLTSGTIAVDGEIVDIRSPQDAQSRGINIVHQHGNLIGEISVLENVLLAEGLSRRAGIFVNWRESAARVRDLLDNVGLSGLDVRTLVSDLSPHQVAMVAIAKAQASDARIIILDEPTSALQAEEVEILFAQMRRLAATGMGFVFVTHRLAEVFRVTDRITVMRDGRLVGTWQTPELDHDRLVDQLVGPEKAAVSRLELDRGHVGDTVLFEARGLRSGVLRGIDLTVRSGEVVGIASLPGEGAEEVIEALYGIRRCEGEILVGGRPVSISSPRDAVRAGLALVPRERLRQGLVSEMSVRENASLASTSRFITDPIFRFLRRGRERAAVAETTRRLSLKSAGLEVPVRTLSGGNQQKVVIARWLMRGASVYLLDSPTNAVDVHTKAEIYALARELAHQNAAVIFTSTETEEFVRLCDRVLVIHDGQLTGELTGDAITVSAIMRLSFGRDNA